VGCFAAAAAVHINFLHVMAAQALDDPAHREFAERQLASLLNGGQGGLRRSAAVAARARPGRSRFSPCPWSPGGARRV
jgi:hypothetical protein